MISATEQKLFCAGSQDLCPQDAPKLPAEDTVTQEPVTFLAICSRCFCCHLGVAVIGFGLSPAPPGPPELWCLRESSLTFHRGGGFPCKVRAQGGPEFRSSGSWKGGIGACHLASLHFQGIGGGFGLDSK